ncbi:MAG: hypothetical protein QOI68_1580, partial [Pseudonocardiales bacterium]|nr:hypothetical protein [Pseudonocardiales bacterium]
MRERRAARLRARRRELNRNRRDRGRGVLPRMAPDSGAFLQRRHALVVAGLVGAMVLAVAGARFAGASDHGTTAAGELA